MTKITVVIGSKKNDLMLFLTEEGLFYPFPFSCKEEIKIIIYEIEYTQHGFDSFDKNYCPQKNYKSDDWNVYFCENLRVKYYKNSANGWHDIDCHLPLEQLG